MSSPTADPAIAVQFDALEGVAADLAALARDLTDDAALCRSAAGSMDAALSGHEGRIAGSTASAWAGLTAAVAARSEAVAGTLRAAVESYRRADADLATRLRTGIPEQGGGR